MKQLLVSTVLAVALSGCATQIKATGTYADIYRAVTDGLAGAEFHEHKVQAKWGTGFEYEKGRLVARRSNSKFSSHLVDVFISPIDQPGVHEHTIKIYGWAPDWTNAFLLKSWRSSAQQDATRAIESQLAATDTIEIGR